MAEQKRAPAPEGEPAETPAAAPRKRFPMKTLIVLGAVLLLEGAAISSAFLLAGKPADAKAGEEEAATLALEAEKPVEELVIADKFQNARSGRTYLYDTEIYVVVKKKNQATVKDQIKEMTAKITADVGTLFRQSEPAHLMEPTLSTLTRQIKVSLSETLGQDADGEPMIQEVLIKKYTQYRSDI